MAISHGEIGRYFGETGEAEWRGLLTHLDLTQGFALFLLLLPGKAAWALCEQELAAHLLARGKTLRRLHFDSPEDLARLPNDALVPSTHDAVGAVWIDLLGPDGTPEVRESWQSATRRALALLNQHRNRLVQDSPLPVFFVAEPWLKSAFREVAPDLWSIRVSVVQLQPAGIGEPNLQPNSPASTRAMISSEAAADPDYALQQAHKLEAQPNLLGTRVDLLLRASSGFYLQGRTRFPIALATAQEAVSLCREPGASEAEPIRAKLAEALNNLAVLLSKVGRRKEALATIQEATELYRVLARRNPGAFRPDLAMSLNNLAGRLGEMGRRAEALASAKEAAELYRTLTRQNPSAFVPGLAMSLGNLANGLSEVGLRSDALAPAQECVDLYRMLARQNPDAFRPQLAESLNNHAVRLMLAGRRAEALLSAQESAELYRALNRQNPDAFGPDLAMALLNLANTLSELGRKSEALPAAQEAVGIFHELTSHYPDAYGPALAKSLSNLADSLGKLGHREEALTTARETVELHRKLARQNPDAFIPDLASALGMMGQVQEANGAPEAALASFREGVERLTPAFQQLPAAFAELIQQLAADYLRVLGASGREPDFAGAEAFLVPVAKALKGLADEAPPSTETTV